MPSYQYIFTMKGLTKVHPPDKVVLKDIWLSFFPGAKIGVLGANGAGKSTLLRVMVGLERDFAGEAFPAEGVSIGLLHQEPALDLDKDVRGNIEEGVTETRALLAEFDRLAERLGEDLSPDEMKKVLERRHAPSASDHIRAHHPRNRSLGLTRSARRAGK